MSIKIKKRERINSLLYGSPIVLIVPNVVLHSVSDVKSSRIQDVHNPVRCFLCGPEVLKPHGVSADGDGRHVIVRVALVGHEAQSCQDRQLDDEDIIHIVHLHVFMIILSREKAAGSHPAAMSLGF